MSWEIVECLRGYRHGLILRGLKKSAKSRRTEEGALIYKIYIAIQFWFFDKYDSEEDVTKNRGDLSTSGRGIINPTCKGPSAYPLSWPCFSYQDDIFPPQLYSHHMLWRSRFYGNTHVRYHPKRRPTFFRCPRPKKRPYLYLLTPCHINRLNPTFAEVWFSQSYSWLTPRCTNREFRDIVSP